MFQLGRSDGYDTINDFERGDIVRLVGEGFMPVKLNVGTDARLIFDLSHRQGTASVEFAGLSTADAEWVRDSFVIG